ncbi:Outer envelope protein 64, mitochondrial [Linum grandiflorum]
MPNQLSQIKANPKLWVLIGVTVAGVLVLAEVQRRRRSRKAASSPVIPVDFGAFIERFEILPSPQPPPPSAKLLLSGLTYAVSDMIDVKEYVTGFGCPDWETTHDAAERTAVIVSALLKKGATCVGKTVTGELGIGISGENKHYGTPVNPRNPECVPGGSSSGSAVAVASGLVDFALGTDTTGDIRIPASFCGVLGYRPSHGVISTIGILPISQSLDAVGLLARDPSILQSVAQALMQLNVVGPKRTRRLILADDLFQLSKVPKYKSISVIGKAIENLSGCQPLKHMNFGQHIASQLPSLRSFSEQSTNLQNGMSTLRALSSAMNMLLRCELKTNHEEWVKTAKPKLSPDVSQHVIAANSAYDNIKLLYKVRTELRTALQSLLKDDGILIIPTVADPPSKLKTKRKQSAESYDRASMLCSIASISGCCQVTVPIGEHDGLPISVSFMSSHGADKFLLDFLLDIYPCLQRQVSLASNSMPLPDDSADAEASELLKEKGNAAYKGGQWNKAVNYYSEAIKLNDTSATYFSNRAAAYLELGCFQQAEQDCTRAITLDKKNVKGYLRRGTARESLMYYKEAAQDFKHALVLEPQNKVAASGEKRLRKLLS